MLSRLIFDESLRAEQPAIVTRERVTTWADLRAQSQHIFETQTALRQRRVGLSFCPAADSYAALAALQKLECDVFVLDARLPFQEAMGLSGQLKLGAFLVPGTDGLSSEVHELPGEETWSGGSTITILTSGSTGKPKAARHSWESVARPVRKGSSTTSPTWLLTYRPNAYAGLQVMLQCFVDRGTLAVPDHDMDPAAIAGFMYNTGVQYVSATPSYWRRLLMFADPDLLRKIPLAQITLGGEIVDQSVLDKLRKHYPHARLAHIYATTELGRCFSVTDGLAGFPVGYLDVPSFDGVELTIRDGELLVRSPNAMRMYDPLSSQQLSSSDWFATGDLVEIMGNRVCFAGRKSDMINVAGSKVYPIEVERVIRTIPGVSDVRVFGKASSIVGELVACEIVPTGVQDREALREVVIRTCRENLASYQQPRLIKLVDQIDLSAASKTLRTKAS